MQTQQQIALSEVQKLKNIITFWCEAGSGRERWSTETGVQKQQDASRSLAGDRSTAAAAVTQAGCCWCYSTAGRPDYLSSKTYYFRCYSQ